MNRNHGGIAVSITTPVGLLNYVYVYDPREHEYGKTYQLDIMFRKSQAEEFVANLNLFEARAIKELWHGDCGADDNKWSGATRILRDGDSTVTSQSGEQYQLPPENKGCYYVRAKSKYVEGVKPWFTLSEGAFGPLCSGSIAKITISFKTYNHGLKDGHRGLASYIDTVTALGKRAEITTNKKVIATTAQDLEEVKRLSTSGDQQTNQQGCIEAEEVSHLLDSNYTPPLSSQEYASARGV